MLSQESDDRPHTAVQTQCNNTPNGSPQHTQVPLQDWAVLIITLAKIKTEASQWHSAETNGHATG